MESKISCSLVLLLIAKLVWEQAKELYFGVSNLKRIYDLQNLFGNRPRNCTLVLAI